MTDPYKSWGVSAQKKFLQPYLSQSTFCKVLPRKSKYILLHADGVGTKGVLSYLWWKETHAMDVWRFLAQDALVMNTDDMACVGATGPFIFSTTLTRNPFYIPDAVVQEIIAGVYDFVEKLNAWGIEAQIAGGETADMPDVIRTVGLEATAYSEMPKKDLIRFRPIRKKIAIVALASYGQTIYENAYNSGIGANGLTAARHLLLSSYYEAYPETFEPQLSMRYQGEFRLQDTLEGYSIGQLLLSPTRTYLPFLKALYAEYRRYLYGVVHCTGGGQTKALKYIQATIIKENWELPPLFMRLLEKTSVAQAFQIFNMGYRMELYVPFELVESIQTLARQWGIHTTVLGVSYPGPTQMEIRYKDEKVHFTP